MQRPDTILAAFLPVAAPAPAAPVEARPGFTALLAQPALPVPTAPQPSGAPPPPLLAEQFPETPPDEERDEAIDLAVVSPAEQPAAGEPRAEGAPPPTANALLALPAPDAPPAEEAPVEPARPAAALREADARARHAGGLADTVPAPSPVNEAAVEPPPRPAPAGASLEAPAAAYLDADRPVTANTALPLVTAATAGVGPALAAEDAIPPQPAPRAAKRVRAAEKNTTSTTGLVGEGAHIAGAAAPLRSLVTAVVQANAVAQTKSVDAGEPAAPRTRAAVPEAAMPAPTSAFPDLEPASAVRPDSADREPAGPRPQTGLAEAVTRAFDAAVAAGRPFTMRFDTPHGPVEIRLADVAESVVEVRIVAQSEASAQAIVLDHAAMTAATDALATAGAVLRVEAPAQGQSAMSLGMEFGRERGNPNGRNPKGRPYGGTEATAQTAAPRRGDGGRLDMLV